ncbi:MAG TPA: DinB family protein [Candidatus Limnocylindrales bacterium]|nr:DinB family protein [Candidatus Limnocylindrales bacterium]
MGFDPADVEPIDGLRAFTTAEVARLLRASAAHITTELEALGDEWARWRPAPGEWSANEALGHIIEADRRGFAGRIRRILAEDGVREEGWDQVAIAAERRDVERTVGEILTEFSAGRSAGLAVVASLSDHDLERHAIHERVGRVTVRDLLHEWVFHDRNHIRQILANSQARAWPAMGNTRRFSHPDR